MKREGAEREWPLRRGKVLDFRTSRSHPSERAAGPAERDAVADSGGPPPRVVAVTSGKGGVGKTNVVANLALALSRRGKEVIVIDADLGLANVDTLLGLHPRATLRHVLRGECSVADVLLDGPGGMRIVPASTGFEEMTALDPGQRLHLLEEIDGLEDAFDVLLIDTAAGISSNVTFFAVAAQETLVVISPEPTSLTDAYALIKVMSQRYAELEFGVLVNMTRSETEGRRAFAQLARVAERFLGVSLRYEGSIPFDGELREAVRRQQAVLELAPRTPASRAFEDLAGRLASRGPRVRAKGGLQFFFRRLLEEDRP